VTLAEVLVGPARAGRLADGIGALRGLEVAEEPLPHETPVELAELRAATGLRMPDCCVFLAALEVGARVASFDARLVKAAPGVGVAAVPS